MNTSDHECVEILLTHPEYSTIEHVRPLLERLKSLESLDNSAVCASQGVLTFLLRLESADPNSVEISEDDHNAQWGHWQYGAAGITITSALVSWEAIGGVAVACRLLAAAIKTHRVAEAICFQRSVREKPSLSVVYLTQLVSHLWSLVEDLGTEKEQVRTHFLLLHMYVRCTERCHF